MARFIPDVKPEEFNNSYGEMKVYEALRSLNDKYTVFYSLSWVGMGSRNGVGEADFVIFHPNKGLLVIEVKSGEIEYRNGEWIQINTRTRVEKKISPYNQARKSQFEILDRLDSNIRDFKLPMLCYAVWFTSVEIADSINLPPESAHEITLDSRSIENPEKAIDKAFDYWANKYRTVSLDSRQAENIIRVLCPHFHIVPKLKTKIEEAERTYIQLTQQQVSLLDFLEEQKTAVIHGLAGTGKTVLAIEKAKRLSEQGETVLFLCFNSFLRDNLKAANAIPGVVFHNAHSLAFEVMGSSDLPIEQVLEEFEDYLEEVFDSEMWNYENVIVDEGQDLDDRLLNRLYELVKKKSGCFYVFYDKNQYIMKNKLPHWIEDAECRLVLHKNCRNTAEVFKVSCSIIGLQNPVKNEIHGEVPVIEFYSGENELEKIVDSFVKRMISEGLKTNEIAILTAKTIDDTWIDLNKKYGGQELSTSSEHGKVLFTTIRKFKGLEAEAILIIDTSMRAMLNDENKRLLYVGTSRAKNILNIAMLEDIESSDMGNYLRSLAPNRALPKNKKGIKRLLAVN